jgi:hypothetical protein
VRPGDTIWLREGVYQGKFTSQLRGTASQPIIVRNYMGERATIDGVTLQPSEAIIQLNSSEHTWYWGLELTESAKFMNPPPGAASAHFGFDGGGPGVRLINNIIHDTGTAAAGAPQYVYGNLMYHNGVRNVGGGYGIYTQNEAGAPVKYLEDNIIHSTAGPGYGIHLYASGGSLKGFVIRGNAIWHTGELTNERKTSILLGGSTPVDNATVSENFLYAAAGRGDRGLQFGYDGSILNGGVTITNNYLTSPFPLLFRAKFSSIVSNGNVAHTRNGASIVNEKTGSGMQMNYNAYYSQLGDDAFEYPAGTRLTLSGWRSATGQDLSSSFARSTPPNAVFLRPNQYEPGRGHLVIYNWSNAATITLNLSSVLTPGRPYEIRNAANYYGTPVLSGTYTGGFVSLPMTGLTVAQPYGLTALPSTAPEFGVFIVLDKSAGGGAANNAPIVNAGGNFSIALPATAALAGVVSDDGLPTGSSLTTAWSAVSGPGVVTFLAPSSPVTTASFSQSGVYVLRLTASDGALSSFDELTVTVNPAVPVISSFTASPATITQGQSSTLSWSVSGATSLSINQGIGTVTGSSRVVTPSQTTTYTLTATNAGGSATRQVTVTVTVVDTTGPVISGINVSGVTANGATITWLTNEPADSQVTYSYNQTTTVTPVAPTLVTTHSVTLTGLVSNATYSFSVLSRDAAGNSTTSSPSTFNTAPANPSPVILNIEAESGFFTAPFQMLSVGGTYYISSTLAEAGSIRFIVNIPAAGTYVIWGRVLAPSSGSDSFYVSVDGGPEDIYDTAEGTWSSQWQWSRVNGRAGGAPLTLNPRTFALAPGAHTLTFRGREANTTLDKLIITSDQAYQPTN